MAKVMSLTQSLWTFVVVLRYSISTYFFYASIDPTKLMHRQFLYHSNHSWFELRCLVHLEADPWLQWSCYIIVYHNADLQTEFGGPRAD